MDTSETYIKMSWEARKDIKKAWNKFSDKQRLGALICFRSFMGMIVNTEHKKFEGIASIIPETMALREWCDPENEDLHIVEIGHDFDDEGFPLLRQDQIQEMMEKHFEKDRIFGISWMGNGVKCQYLIEKLRWFLGTDYCEKISSVNQKTSVKQRIYQSMEQLWLAFYMYEKHQKFWDGEQWKKK